MYIPKYVVSIFLSRCLNVNTNTTAAHPHFSEARSRCGSPNNSLVWSSIARAIVVVEVELKHFSYPIIGGPTHRARLHTLSQSHHVLFYMARRVWAGNLY